MADQQADRINYLWERYQRDEISKAEYFEMADLLEQNPAAFDQFTNTILDSVTADAGIIDHTLAKERANMVFKNILAAQIAAPVRRMFAWKRWIAAASVLVFISLGVYFLFFHKTGGPGMLTQEQRFKNDIQAPGTNKATLRLADGRIIELDTARGQLTKAASKVGGDMISYSTDETVIFPEYHTLSVPFGSQPMQLSLADGSRVWLNTGS